MRTSHNSATRSGWQVRPGPKGLCDELATARLASNTGTPKSNWSAEVVANGRCMDPQLTAHSSNRCQHISVRACDALTLFCCAPPHALMSVMVKITMVRSRSWPAVSSGGRDCGRWCGVRSFEALRASQLDSACIPQQKRHANMKMVELT